MGTLFVDKLDPQSGTSLEIGSSGDTITIPSGATIANSGTATGFGESNTPVFQAMLTSDQTLSSGSFTKIQFNNTSTADLSFDPQSTYDNTTNYRFTPAIAGKYHCYGIITYEAGLNQGEDMYFNFKINGSDASQYEFNSGGSGIRNSLHYSSTFDLDSDDYVEIFGYHSKGSNHNVGGNASLLRTIFGAYRLIGA